MNEKVDLEGVDRIRRAILPICDVPLSAVVGAARPCVSQDDTLTNTPYNEKAFNLFTYSNWYWKESRCASSDRPGKHSIQFIEPSCRDYLSMTSKYA